MISNRLKNLAQSKRLRIKFSSLEIEKARLINNRPRHGKFIQTHQTTTSLQLQKRIPSTEKRE